MFFYLRGMKYLIGIMLLTFTIGCNESTPETKPIDKNTSIKQEIQNLYNQLDYENKRVDFSDESIELRVKAISLIGDSKERSKEMRELSDEIFEYTNNLDRLQYKIDSLEALIN